MDGYIMSLLSLQKCMRNTAAMSETICQLKSRTHMDSIMQWESMKGSGRKMTGGKSYPECIHRAAKIRCGSLVRGCLRGMGYLKAPDCRRAKFLCKRHALLDYGYRCFFCEAGSAVVLAGGF